MKMMKKIMKILLVLTLLVSILSVPVMYDAYNLYQNNYSEEKLIELVDEIQSNPNYVQLQDLSQDYIDALLDSEDQRFYKHNGYDIIAIGRAVITNIANGRFVEGGSTITQQLAKNLFFSFEKKMARKVSELFVAIQIEKQYTKDEILELYCNIIYFGNNVYGVQSAANYYYGKDNQDLTKMEIDALVKTIKSPNLYNPFAIDN